MTSEAKEASVQERIQQVLQDFEAHGYKVRMCAILRIVFHVWKSFIVFHFLNIQTI